MTEVLPTLRRHNWHRWPDPLEASGAQGLARANLLGPHRQFPWRSTPLATAAASIQQNAQHNCATLPASPRARRPRRWQKLKNPN